MFLTLVGVTKSFFGLAIPYDKNSSYYFLEGWGRECETGNLASELPISFFSVIYRFRPA